MASIISDSFATEKQIFSRPAFAHECKHIAVESNIDSYFLLTDFSSNMNMSISAGILTYSIYSNQTIFSRQMSIVSMANKMFYGSQPMSGRDLK